jgi:hypothetical protein
LDYFKYPNKQTSYLLASQAPPALFDHLKNYKVAMWHFKGQIENEEQHFRGEPTISWGCMIGVQFRAFPEGEIISDPALITQLLDEECPIRPKEDWDQMMLCPHCNRTVLVKPTEPDAQFSAETAKKIARLGLG